MGIASTAVRAIADSPVGGAVFLILAVGMVGYGLFNIKRLSDGEEGYFYRGYYFVRKHLGLKAALAYLWLWSIAFVLIGLSILFTGVF